MQINRCLEAISNQEMKDDKSYNLAGDSGVIDSVKALRYTLVDFGEARVKSDVDRIFLEWQENLFKGNPGKKFKASNVHRKEFEIIIQVLNKYGMLFESQPRGYSNVEMKSI